MFKFNVQAKRQLARKKLRKYSVAFMNSQAEENGYENLMDLMMSDEDDMPNEILESKAGRVYRRTVRATIRQIFLDVMDGSRSMPTEAELKTELPKLILPE